MLTTLLRSSQQNERVLVTKNVRSVQRALLAVKIGTNLKNL